MPYESVKATLDGDMMRDHGTTMDGYMQAKQWQDAQKEKAEEVVAPPSEPGSGSSTMDKLNAI